MKKKQKLPDMELLKKAFKKYLEKNYEFKTLFMGGHGWVKKEKKLNKKP